MSLVHWALLPTLSADDKPLALPENAQKVRQKLFDGVRPFNDADVSF